MQKFQFKTFFLSFSLIAGNSSFPVYFFTAFSFTWNITTSAKNCSHKTVANDSFSAHFVEKWASARTLHDNCHTFQSLVHAGRSANDVNCKIKIMIFSWGKSICTWEQCSVIFPLFCNDCLAQDYFILIFLARIHTNSIYTNIHNKRKHRNNSMQFFSSIFPLTSSSTKKKWMKKTFADLKRHSITTSKQ